ncbi:MAG: ATP-binding protein [Oscillospiraceae bacterium]|nr:ATP-binding protein [Oscillospiraceae bacterium]
MFRRNSIFVKILIPIVIILILQPIFISSVLFAYGINNSLDENAIESISSNAENRSLVLTDKMTSAWSNLDKLEFDLINILDDYIADERLLLTDIIGNNTAETKLLGFLSEPLINALRQTTASGAFIYFGSDIVDETVNLNGLYYQRIDSLAPASPDNLDLVLLRGSEEIAKTARISLHRFWQETFSFSSEHPDNWATLIKPLTAARNNRYLPSTELAFWSRALYINQDNPEDINPCITYTRPIIYEGTVVAMIGTEVQLSYLERDLSASDFIFDQCGYMLIRYSNAEYYYDKQHVESDLVLVTGAHIRQLVGSKDGIRLEKTSRPNVYSIDAIEPVQVVLRPINLYNADSPFGDDQWAVAAIGTDVALFWMSRMLTFGIILSSAVALTIGTVLLWFIIRRTTKPLISIAGQIKKNAPSKHIIVSSTSAYEVSLLCDTINTMKDERADAEAELRTERERYLIALESVADTVIEYDVFKDSFMMYYFKTENDASVLCSNVVEKLIWEIKNGNFCHEDDKEMMISFFRGYTVKNVEVRIKAEIFSHITDAVQDDGYYWFFIKSSRVLNNNGEIVKIIGTAREFTDRKLREFANIELSRRDPTTKLFNHDYGVSLTKAAIDDALKNNKQFSLSIISINNYDKIEAHYGRIFAASILMKLFNAYPVTDKNIKTRLSNDEVLLYIHDGGKDEAKAYANQFIDGASRLYTGENSELSLKIGIGTALSEDAENFETLMQYALKAARYAELKNENCMELYSDLPKGKRKEEASNRNRPINISFEVRKGGISNYTFELFESTADTHSAVNMLIAVIGRIYSLGKIIICAYDTDFGTGRVTHEWNPDGVATGSYTIEKVSNENWAEFEAKLDEDGSLLYTGDDADKYSPALRQLLYIPEDRQAGGYCCVMYENGIPFGRVLFHTSGNTRGWVYEELRELYEITKIIAVNLSNEKSISASRAKSEFLSRISHEIRTPMNAIIGMTNIAKNSVKDAERLHDSLEKIEFSAKHLMSLINNVLEMSRIESGKMDIESNYFSLDGFTQDIDMLMRPSIEDNDIFFEISNAVNAQIQLLGDEYRLRQVIINLLSNANKFTAKKGTIIFAIKELEQDGDTITLLFSVRDNGAGIAIEDQSSIFETFEQARSSSSAQKQLGSGLGLAISAGIVSAMGGTIQLESKPGEGSDFFFTLKFKTALGKAVVAEDKQADVYHKNLFSGKNVLLVDDLEINLEIARFILEEVGFNIDTAMDGQKAVEMFLASNHGYYDIIIMDIQMPVMDGLTATRNIRKSTNRPDARTVPIVAMTANAFDEDLKEAIESGMNGHITKPIDINNFHKVMQALLLDKGEES